MISADDGLSKNQETRDTGWRKMRPSETLHLLSAVVVWLVTGTTISSLNKWIFVVYNFRYPLLLSALHMLTAIVVGVIKYWFVQNHGVAEQDLTPSAKCKVFLLSLTFCASIAFGNIGLNYVQLSFAQMIYTTTPIFTLAISSLVLGEQHHVLKYTAMMPICLGASFSIMGEVQFDQKGCLFVLAATMLRGVKSIQQSILLQEEKINSVFLLYLMAIPSFCILAVAALVLENLAALQSPHHYNSHLWGFIVLSCLGSVLYNLASSSVISLTSAVTLHILGNLSVVGNLLLSQLLFGSQLSALSCVGAVLTLSGMMIYQNSDFIVAYMDSRRSKTSNGKICNSEAEHYLGCTYERSSSLDLSQEPSSSSEICHSPDPSLEQYDDFEPWEELDPVLESSPELCHDLEPPSEFKGLEPPLELDHGSEPSLRHVQDPKTSTKLNPDLKLTLELVYDQEPSSQDYKLEPTSELVHLLDLFLEPVHDLQPSIGLVCDLQPSVDLVHDLQPSSELSQDLEQSSDLVQDVEPSSELLHDLEPLSQQDHGLEPFSELNHELEPTLELFHRPVLKLEQSSELAHNLEPLPEILHDLEPSSRQDYGLESFSELDHDHLNQPPALNNDREPSSLLNHDLEPPLALDHAHDFVHEPHESPSREPTFEGQRDTEPTANVELPSELALRPDTRTEARFHQKMD
ncbi:solute carrier family 35 member E4 isoform X2 [Clarias gariepinus]|nr:solute carrier family 35 member E4 isoform X2 [Clarias gariepinus]XP_053332161.1 solute carrier family 35 member E4 isoform X2 [Clarias gariepinus]